MAYRCHASVVATLTDVVLNVVHDFDFCFAFCHARDSTADHDSLSYIQFCVAFVYINLCMLMLKLHFNCT